MKYLLLVTVDPSITPEEAPGQIDGWLDRLGEDRLLGSALQSPSTAATVRVRRSERLVTDGPFAETKEALGGYYLVEAEDLQQAVEIAQDVPHRFGYVEVRSIRTFD
jgi:hypothetical protein